MVDGEDRAIEQVVRELRRTAVAPMDPAFDDRVMAAVRGEQLAVRPTMRKQHAARRALGWLVRPRMVAMSPLAGLAMAASIMFVAVLASSWRYDGLNSRGGRIAAVAAGGAGDRTGSAATGAQAAPPGATAETETRLIQFVLLAPRAATVSLVGDFNDWDTSATPLERVEADGKLWTVAVPLKPGRYTYTFVVNGEEWVADPAAPRALTDDFGRPNSVVTVGASST